MTCPLPRYYLCHIVLALLITLAIWPIVSLEAGLCAGAAFYVGREYTQWESGLPFDLPGLTAPLGVCLALLAFSQIYL